MFTADQLWEIAAGLERCAIGYRQDAARYKGRRRERRLNRASCLESLAVLKMVAATGEAYA